MKNLFLLFLLGVMFVLTAGCAELNALRSNAFEAKFPISQCPRKVNVDDQEPALELGKFISPSKGIYLLTPYILISSTHFTNSADSVYLTKITDYLGNLVENQFLQQDWIEGVIPVQIPESEIDSLVVPPAIGSMISNVLEQDTIDYRNWDVPHELLLENNNEYSLLLFINGIVGYDELIDDKNHLFFFLIDNEVKKVVYSDYLKFQCDVRNTNGLRKVLDYAYLKLLDVRFKQHEAKN